MCSGAKLNTGYRENELGAAEMPLSTTLQRMDSIASVAHSIVHLLAENVLPKKLQLTDCVFNTRSLSRTDVEC